LVVPPRETPATEADLFETHCLSEDRDIPERETFPLRPPASRRTETRQKTPGALNHSARPLSGEELWFDELHY